MVPSQEEEVLGILDFVAEEQQDRLKALLSSIDIVAQEEVVGGRGEPAHLKQSDEVGVLSMDVPHNLHRRGELYECRLA